MDFSYNQTLLKEYGIDLTLAQYQANAKTKVVVGVSGGVDSSVSALILKLQGYEVMGLFMKNWDDSEDEKCTASKDYQDVVSVCELLDIPYYSINFAKEYWDNVFSEFLEEYEKGFTPNPDILCNKEIKFKVFFEKAMHLGAQYLATGHYCQNINGQLSKGMDPNKDQTYFLYAINEGVMDRVLFPIGHMEKPLVREIATKYKLVTHDKKDSTGICFIGKRKFREFLNQYIKDSYGDFKLLDGTKVGKHQGMPFYTIGQRKGLGLGGPGEPWFVVKKDIKNNIVYVERGTEHPALFADELWASNLTWINQPSLEFPLECRAKVRYRQKDQKCTAYKIDEQVHVVFDEPQRAITCGQSLVLYSENICLGGGIITKVGLSHFDQKKLC
jgi:tRNA-specific 2-thiouridylase